MKKEIILLLIFVSSGFSQAIKINEIMYSPKNGEPEWIELCNTSADKINIKGWKIRHHTTTWYTITSTDFFVRSDSFVVMTKSDTIFSFHSLDSSIVLICPAVPTDFLVNTGDTISIRDSTGTLADSVLYEPSWGGSNGKSLERISTELSPFLSTNWGTSLDSSGGTPGRKNSIAAWSYDLKVSSFSASLSSTDSSAVFDIVVKNCGVHSTSPFDVDVYLDYNGDHLPEPDEVVAETDNVPGLKACDSTSIVSKAKPQNFRAAGAFAVVKFASDQDTTNNSMWVKPKFSYSKESLVVNEIMYAPKSPEPEWVELYNNSNDSLNLNCFTISDNSGTEAVITGTDYLFPPSDYVVVAHDTGFFNLHPGVRTKTLIAKIPPLNNTGDAVTVHDAGGNLIDSVSYAPSWGGNTGGKSLERILPAGDSNDPQDFETSADSSGSTPARINSVTPRSFDLAVGTVTYSPFPIQSGGSITISACVINRGMKLCGPAKAVLFSDKNGNGSCDSGEPIDSIEIPAMTPGDSTVAIFTVHDLLFGSHRFGIFISYPGDELTTNNTKIISVDVGLPPASVVINEIMYAPKSPEQDGSGALLSPIRKRVNRIV
ncbi:MAG TPA: lamin tail domain-containing protein [Candidatus Acidoferrales bacterium]|nr:lamin tail domain-containing protein [Candidatus Acidoferrales bacterium]